MKMLSTLSKAAIVLGLITQSGHTMESPDFISGLPKSIERNIQTPDEELIFAVKGYKQTGAAVIVGMVNPVLGLLISCSSTEESSHDLDNIQKALTKGANVNCRYVDTWTPLLYAAYGGHPRIAQFLLQNNADKTLAPTQGSWVGYTPLKVADYYLDRYTTGKKSCKPDMTAYYDDQIQRYAEVIRILK